MEGANGRIFLTNMRILVLLVLIVGTYGFIRLRIFPRTVHIGGMRALSAGKGFGAPKSKKNTEEQQMIEDIRATLLERPREEPLHYNLGLLLLSSSPKPAEATKREALLAFENAVMLNPTREGSWYNLAVLRDELGTKESALEAYDKTLELSSMEKLRVACYANKISILISAGDLEKAAKCSEEAVLEFPNEASLWCGMGVVLRMDRNVEWSTKAFENALACCEEGSGNEDENTLVALNNLGALYASSIAIKAAEGKEVGAEAAAKAVNMYERALERAPEDLSSLYGLGVLRRDLGDVDKARALFEHALQVAPDDKQIPYQLAMLDQAAGSRNSGMEVESAPAEYVSSLFDYYASHDYDAHILSLDYAGPQLLWKAFEQVRSKDYGDAKSIQDASVLEVGCGSGLVGRHFRMKGFGYSFEGCDLSSVMMRQATDAIFSKQDDPTNVDMVYSRVECMDAETFLTSKPKGQADVVLAGDVLCYVGKLDNLFKAAAASLKPGKGLFVFTLEQLEQQATQQQPRERGFALQSSGRFAHTSAYVNTVAAASGFTVVAYEEATLRKDGLEEVKGLVYALREATTDSA